VVSVVLSHALHLAASRHCSVASPVILNGNGHRTSIALHGVTWQRSFGAVVNARVEPSAPTQMADLGVPSSRLRISAHAEMRALPFGVPI
jgi:hypothetical protein